MQQPLNVRAALWFDDLNWRFVGTHLESVKLKAMVAALKRKAGAPTKSQPGSMKQSPQGLKKPQHQAQKAEEVQQRKLSSVVDVSEVCEEEGRNVTHHSSHFRAD